MPENICRYSCISCILLISFACNNNHATGHPPATVDTLAITAPDTLPGPKQQTPAFRGSNKIETSGLTPDQLLQYAETLIGVPYLYGSTDPSKGFDCSGFITYVFNHFNVSVPRSSIDFTNIETEVPLSDARPGDLILFTGTDSTNPAVGHMGIIHDVTKNAINFIHSTSGKAHGVTITELNDYYRGRFVKLVRIFGHN